MSGLILRYLGYFGPDKCPADLLFEPGLNVICGASETGKSFIAESIDFMLGQENPVRDIEERAGYDRVRLLIESEGWEPLTLDRSIEGGHFRAYKETLFNDEPRTKAITLRAKHSAARQDTLSYALLERVGLASRVLRKNAKGDTRSLSFRDLARLCIVNEEEIQRRISPLLSGQYVTAPVEYAVFKLLLTGTDDSALVSVSETTKEVKQDGGKIELLDEMIEELQAELDEEGADEEELRGQLDRLEASLEEQSKALANIQTALNALLERRGNAAKALRHRRARLVEIDELVSRFNLLDTHYETDLRRLEAIHESGSYFIHLEQKPCPLCGALPDSQHLDSDCLGNTEAVIQAAEAEIEKIKRLRTELGDTLDSLRCEYSEIEGSLTQFQEEYDSCENELSDIVAPAVSTERASYNQLVIKRSEVRIMLEKIERMQRLVVQRRGLERAGTEKMGEEIRTQTGVSKNILDEFSRTIERILQEWHFPYANRVFFDESKRDFQIAGRERGSMGKGLRSITHAAVNIGLMEFCRKRGLPHPGFVVLDSPLLAYWKPEGEEDDLRGTDLDEMFYRYLLGLQDNNQVIILENKHPPGFVAKEGHVTIFTKNHHQGRYGFFPMGGDN